ncbi:MAG: hypothetical protein ABSH22_01810, partial [Tepidisphaeraceae bacterium]
MSVRSRPQLLERYPLWIFFAAAVLAVFPPLLRAQEAVQVQPDVANSRFQFTGSVNSADVYVRSGPGEGYYTTMKLPQGTQVTVVGIKFDWLKIIPPQGSFCYVSKLYIERRGDGTVGRVTHPDINVRAGSALNEMKTTVVGKMNAGDDVKIVGEQDEYYKIEPPQGTYLYVAKQFIDPVRVLTANAAPVGEISSGEAATSASSAADESASAAPTTQPAAPADATAAAPTTQPAVAQVPAGPTPAELAETEYQALETEFQAASAKPLSDQPAADLAKRYEALTKNDALPDADKENAGFRLAILKVRLDAQARLADVAKMETQAAAQSQVLKAEQDELQKRLDANEVHLYAAVGQLEPSSLQFGAETLYRLVDPATSRTVIYVKGDDASAVKLMGQFVGVRGDAADDAKLNIKVIPFTVIEAVDAAEVNHKVMAG